MRITVPIESITPKGRGAGQTAVLEAARDLGAWAQAFLNNYSSGLNNFETAMSFASDEEAKPRYFDAALREVGAVLLDELINKATDGMPIVGPAVKGAKKVVESLHAESNRAAAAAGEAQISAYIQEMRKSLGKEGGLQAELLGTVTALRRTLLPGFHEAVLSDGTGNESQDEQIRMIEEAGMYGHLTGAGALFLQNLKKEVKLFKASIPTTSEFQKRFTERFADTPGWTATANLGGRESGSLHLHMQILREYDQKNSAWVYSLVSSESTWKLYTTAPKPDRLAQSLSNSIGGNLANTDLPKYLHVRVETEVPYLNKYGTAIIYFKTPDSPEYRGHVEELSRWVWEETNIPNRALAVSKVSGAK